jgi:hypothetical protein
MKLKKLLGGSVQVWGGDERIQAIDRVLPANHQWQVQVQNLYLFGNLTFNYQIMDVK